MRRRTRYLGVLRGGNSAAKAKLLQYLAGEIEVTYPEKSGARIAKLSVWVRPFVLDLPAAKKVLVSGKRKSDLKVGAYFVGFAFGPPAESDRIQLKNWTAPQAVITKNRTDSGTRRPSKLTGLSYKSYGGQTITYPFGAGQTAAQKDEDAVFRTIYGRVKKEDPRFLCSYTPGSFSL